MTKIILQILTITFLISLFNTAGAETKTSRNGKIYNALTRYVNAYQDYELIAWPSEGIKDLNKPYIVINIFKANTNYHNRIAEGAILFGNWMIGNTSLVFSYVEDITANSSDGNYYPYEVRGKNHLASISNVNLEDFIICATLKTDRIAGLDEILDTQCKPLLGFWNNNSENFHLKHKDEYVSLVVYK